LFSEVERILSDDGIFTFDVSLENNSIAHQKKISRTGMIDKIKYNHSSEYNPVNRIHKNIFTLFFPDNQVIREVHIQKIYPFNMYFNLIDKSGLYVSDCFEAFSFKKGRAESKRVQFKLKKRKRNAFIS
jgi:hypothetical protein